MYACMHACKVHGALSARITRFSHKSFTITGGGGRRATNTRMTCLSPFSPSIFSFLRSNPEPASLWVVRRLSSLLPTDLVPIRLFSKYHTHQQQQKKKAQGNGRPLLLPRGKRVTRHFCIRRGHISTTIHVLKSCSYHVDNNDEKKKCESFFLPSLTEPYIWIYTSCHSKSHLTLAV